MNFAAAHALHFSVLFLERRRTGVVERTRRCARGSCTLEPYGAPRVRHRPCGHGARRAWQLRLLAAASSHRHAAFSLHLVSNLTYHTPAHNSANIHILILLFDYNRSNPPFRIDPYHGAVRRNESAAPALCRRRALFVFHMSMYKYSTRKRARVTRHTCL